ncbi:SpvB/TcaC N-terminal domain-containing protein [Pseudomonas sp. NPDC089752]|uniref:SpvB/TcaC N-terminal domain-containing protein n=1 Tax=Pseudomonas sp. NPDC089752 TaxID=3364472 RepID=UPI003818ACA0
MMTDQLSPGSERDGTAFYTPPSLPKGGGTVSIGGGMLSAGGPDGSAGWQMPLPSPAGRALSATLALQYSSAGGNSAFGAGWDCALPAVMRMTRFGFPQYDGNDRLVGPNGVEIVKAGPERTALALPFSKTPIDYRVTPWCARFGSRAERLEHWVVDGADDAGFWLHFLADGSLSLYGWSPLARLSDPADPAHVAGWYLEETVSARGEHVVYRYRPEDELGCSKEELTAHPQVAHLYLAAVYAMNTTSSEALLIPQGAFDEADFLTFTLFDYDERDPSTDLPPDLQPKQPWPVREDPQSFWRYGFNVRIRRLCREVLLWHRTARMDDTDDDTPVLVSRLRLEYDSSAVTSILVSAQQLTHEVHSRMPPMEFELSRPGRAIPGWEPVAELDGFWSPAWQMADLYGEGLPGLLYREHNAWRYRPPQRLKQARVGQTDPITWGTAVTLGARPAIETGVLTDLNGDGRPEWLITAGGLRGSYTLAPDGNWGGLAPLAEFPSEYGHPQAQLTDLTGDGLQDVLMLHALGSNTVRLYPAAGTAGWLAAINKIYEGAVPLPSVDTSEHQLVTFADPAGSGQAHLVCITGTGVTLWPSLGYGKFANAVQIPGFAVTDFNASRVFLADTDGAGTTDILYLQPDKIRVFISECGNRYREAAFVPAPEGVVLDSNCQLQVADMRGQGTADLLLTVPHWGPDLEPRTWTYRFNDRRPWLLETISDNAGSRTELEYRSSAQAWLDEKAAVQARTGATPVSYLPFPVHTVSRVTTVNEITGLCLGSQTTYLGGVWDGREREFAGFTRLIQTDTHDRVEAGAAELSPPMRTCSWFYSGIEARDGQAQDAFTDMETTFPAMPVRFTRWKDNAEEEFSPEIGSDLRAQLFRALRGQMMRTEVYGEDAHIRADCPYTVTRPRLQVRAYATADNQRPAALTTAVETLSFACERVVQDPLITQSIVLEQDAYGSVLQSVTINYPRQLTEQALKEEEQERCIYPSSLPPGLIDASCDPQQYDCWVNLTRATVHNLVTGDDFVIGLADTTRADVVRLGVDDIPSDGFNVEVLLNNGLPLDQPDKTTLKGFEKVVWRESEKANAAMKPSRQALQAYTRTAMLDKACLDVLRPTFEQTLRDLVEDALRKPQACDQVLARVSKRLAQAPGAATAYLLLMAYVQTQPNDEAAVQILRDGLKRVISVEQLQRRLLFADPAQLPDGLQAAVFRESRVANESLWAVLEWFSTDEGLGSASMPVIHAAVDGALNSPQSVAVFWRVVLAALAATERAVVLPANVQGWLESVRSVLGLRVQEETLEELLRRGGYIAMNRAPDAEELADPADPQASGAPGISGEPQVQEAYAGHHGISHYQDATHFWQPAAVQENTLIGRVQLVYTAHDIAVRSVTDAAGLTSVIETYDWRFISPIKIQDANDNISEVTLDALGRVMHRRFYGTETPAGGDQAVMTGYCSGRAFVPPATVELAVALNDTKKVPVAEAFTVVADSWMPLELRADGSTARRRCGELAWLRAAERLRKDAITPPSIMTERTPPHVIQIQTDRYDDDPEQQVRVRVMLNGGGQVLQTAILNPPGEAFARTEAGGLVVDANGQAVTLPDVAVRWAVTGKTEFDNKGQAVRVWLPFYLNDWRWVSDDSAREGIYADTHVFDAAGREVKVVRAAGEDVEGVWANYLRRVQYYPWFAVSEDENDTWQEVIEQAREYARRTLH